MARTKKDLSDNINALQKIVKGMRSAPEAQEGKDGAGAKAAGKQKVGSENRQARKAASVAFCEQTFDCEVYNVEGRGGCCALALVAQCCA